MGQMAGMAEMVSRTSSNAAASLLGLESDEDRPERPAFVRSGSQPVVSLATDAPAGEHRFRSAYRLTGDTLVMLDQRGIPEKIEEVTAKRGSDVAYYLRTGVIRGGPAMAQVAAYGLALTAAERAPQPAAARDVELRRTRRALAEARPAARLVSWAMGRSEARSSNLGEEADGPEVAAALRDEADTIAAEFQAGHARIASQLADLLPVPDDRPLAVLVHGDQGALGGGLVGTGLAALRALHEAGRELRIYVTEARPFMDGARLVSWELRQAGLAHKVLPDAAVAWLFHREPVDAVLVSADWVAANGDVAALIGSRAVAQQAAANAHPEGGRVQVIACGLAATIDLATPNGAAIPVEMRPARDLSAYLAAVPIRVSDALVPATDVVPAEIVSALVTERGVASPPTPGGVAGLASQDGPA